MGRPMKPIAMCTGVRTKEEIARREEMEDSTDYKADLVYQIPKELNAAEKKAYLAIVSELREANVLANLDIPLLIITANSLVEMAKARKHIKKNGSVYFYNGKFIKNPSVDVLRTYQGIFHTSCIQLGLSPSSRTKLSSINLKASEESQDDVLKILGGDL